MKCLFLLFGLMNIAGLAHAQDTLLVDLDHDSIADSVLLDREEARIVCRLSTQKFKKARSREMGVLNEQAGVVATKSGFEFYNDWMRAGYRNQFRYDAKTKRLQLIGMSRYEFGNAMNDGSGESSVNLLTKDYLGKWNYFDEEGQVLVELPVIKTKMPFRQTFLEDFSDATYSAYADRCSSLFGKAKEKMRQKNKRPPR